jgi:hypothetical protein
MRTGLTVAQPGSDLAFDLQAKWGLTVRAFAAAECRKRNVGAANDAG